MSNLFGTFVGGYVCTGSFGASAVLSKAGVRTPLAGLFSALILVLALYALTAVFYYIPMAALAGLIIHAVANLVTPPHALYKYWQISPPELIIWIAGVVIALFLSLEISIYVTIGMSLALLLVRMARSKGVILGRVRIYRVRTTTASQESSKGTASPPSSGVFRPSIELPSPADKAPSPETADTDGGSRNVFLPLDRMDASNPSVAVEPPYPGVFVYRFSEGLNYVNQAHHMARLLAYITARTRPAGPCAGAEVRPSDRLWNDPGPPRIKKTVQPAEKPARLTEIDSRAPNGEPASPRPQEENHEQTQQQQSPPPLQLPRLRAVVLDCSAVNNVDITSVQGLVDARAALDQHACCEGGGERGSCVEWHFAGLTNPWARRALAVAGFGLTTVTALGTTPPARGGNISADDGPEPTCGFEPVYVVAPSSVAGATAEVRRRARPGPGVEEEGRAEEVLDARMAVVHGVDRPFFHVDLTEAVDAAIKNAKRVEERERMREK